MTSEVAKDIEMEFRDVLAVHFNNVPQALNSRQYVGSRYVNRGGEFMYQRNEPRKLGMYDINCNGVRVASIACKPHKSMTIYEAFDPQGCFIQKTLERIMYSIFPAVRVTILKEE